MFLMLTFFMVEILVQLGVEGRSHYPQVPPAGKLSERPAPGEVTQGPTLQQQQQQQGTVREEP